MKSAKMTAATASLCRRRVWKRKFERIYSDEVAEHFGLLVKPLMEAITQRDEESRTLAALRDTLVPKLLSGEVRVKETMQLIDNG